MNDLAVIYAQQGDLPRAQEIWKKTLANFREIGNVEGVAAAYNNLGEVVLQMGIERNAEGLEDGGVEVMRATGEVARKGPEPVGAAIHLAAADAATRQGDRVAVGIMIAARRGIDERRAAKFGEEDHESFVHPAALL